MRRQKKGEFVGAAGKAFEIVKAIAEAVYEMGGSDQDLRRILEHNSPLPKQIAKLVVATFRNDRRQIGWKLVKDVGFKPVITSASHLRLVHFLGDFEGGVPSVDGKQLLAWAKSKPLVKLGQFHAEYLLKHQHEIPREWREYTLLFLGTVWRDLVGKRRLVGLICDRSVWRIEFCAVDGDYYEGAKVVCHETVPDQH